MSHPPHFAKFLYKMFVGLVGRSHFSDEKRKRTTEEDKEEDEQEVSDSPTAAKDISLNVAQESDDVAALRFDCCHCKNCFCFVFQVEQRLIWPTLKSLISINILVLFN